MRYNAVCFCFGVCSSDSCSQRKPTIHCEFIMVIYGGHGNDAYRFQAEKKYSSDVRWLWTIAAMVYGSHQLTAQLQWMWCFRLPLAILQRYKHFDFNSHFIVILLFYVFHAKSLEFTLVNSKSTFAFTQSQQTMWVLFEREKKNKKWISSMIP